MKFCIPTWLQVDRTRCRLTPSHVTQHTAHNDQQLQQPPQQAYSLSSSPLLVCHSPSMLQCSGTMPDPSRCCCCVQQYAQATGRVSSPEARGRQHLRLGRTCALRLHLALAVHRGSQRGARQLVWRCFASRSADASASCTHRRVLLWQPRHWRPAVHSTTTDFAGALARAITDPHR